MFINLKIITFLSSNTSFLKFSLNRFSLQIFYWFIYLLVVVFCLDERFHFFIFFFFIYYFLFWLSFVFTIIFCLLFFNYFLAVFDWILSDSLKFLIIFSIFWTFYLIYASIFSIYSKSLWWSLSLIDFLNSLILAKC